MNQETFKNRKLLDITIPGSHDAATYTLLECKSARYAVTQTRTLREQFELGVRYFDIRVQRTKSSKKGKEKELVFFHGTVKSSKHDVFPNMKSFLDSVRASNEIVVLKLHFKDGGDFDLFREIYLLPQIMSMLVSPSQFKTYTISKLLLHNKRIVLMTNNAGGSTDISLDYKSSTFGGWAKTRDTEKLYKNMNEVRQTVSDSTLGKLRVIQTNQPALVGSGPERFASVLVHDEKPQCRLVVSRFIDESQQLIKQAYSENNNSLIATARSLVSGVISLDNIGSDSNKNKIVGRIIDLNLDAN